MKQSIRGQQASTLAISALAFAFSLSLSPNSQAAAVTYTVDTVLSSLTLSGSVTITPGPGVIPFGPQGPPSSVTALYGGTIAGDLIGSTLTIGAGSSLLAAPSVAPFLPIPPSGPGPDNYGVLIGGAAPVAYRAIVFSPTGTLTSGLAPGSSAMAFAPSSYADYDATALGGPVGTVSLSTLPSSANSSAGLVSISIVGLTETLTLPVSVTYTGSISGAPFTSTFAGTIVATRTIPEPSVLAFGLVGFVGLLLRRKR